MILGMIVAMLEHQQSFAVMPLLIREDVQMMQSVVVQ
jgi:hypothetical protein